MISVSRVWSSSSFQEILARIWRDRKLDGIDYFDEQIEEHLNKTAILVAVMSPPYMNSEWCRRELDQFLETARAQGRPRIGNKARVVKVIKNPIDREAHPPELQNVLGYEFFRVIDQASGKTRELNKIFGPEDEQLFYAKLYDLVTDLVEPLKLIREQRDAAVALATTETPSGKTVYLAETTYDLHPQRDQIRRELEMNGHRVLPDRPLSHRGPELLTQVQDGLERSTLSIHLVGERYSLVPEAAERSVIELQNALAAERSAAAGLTRVIWLPAGLQAQGEKQQALVQALRDDPAGAELLETPLEDLKTFIQDKLRPQPQAAAPEAPPDDRLPLLYLLFSQPDQDDVWTLDDFLFDQGFETKQALFDGNGDLDQDYHQTMLNECDAVLIYYGQAERKWVELTLNDLARSVEAVYDNAKRSIDGRPGPWATSLREERATSRWDFERAEKIMQDRATAEEAKKILADIRRRVETLWRQHEKARDEVVRERG